MAIATHNPIPVPPMTWAAWLRKEADEMERQRRSVVISPKAARELAKALQRVPK